MKCGEKYYKGGRKLDLDYVDLRIIIRLEGIGLRGRKILDLCTARLGRERIWIVFRPVEPLS